MADRKHPQPVAGDVVVGCYHQPNLYRGAHVYRISDMSGSPVLEFTRPDGTQSVAKWLAVCNTCFVEFGGDVEGALERGQVKIGCDLTWPKNAEPIEYEEDS